MAETVFVGLQCQLLSFNGVTWDSLASVIDLSNVLERETISAKSRAAIFEQAIPHLLDNTIDFTFLEDLVIGGNEKKLYRNTASHASPTWALVGASKDVSFDGETQKIDCSSRLSSWKKNRRGTSNYSGSFQVVVDSGDTGTIAALRTAYLAGTQIEFALATGLSATTGTRIRRYPACILSKFSEQQKLEEGLMVEIEVKRGRTTDLASTTDTGSPVATTYETLLAAWRARTDLELAIVSSSDDITVTGTKYWHLPAAGIFKVSEKAPFGDVASLDVSMALTGDTAPSLVTVA